VSKVQHRQKQGLNAVLEGTKAALEKTTVVLEGAKAALGGTIAVLQGAKAVMEGANAF